MSDPRRFYEEPAGGAKRSAPAVERNRQPILEVLRDWLPESGLVLELASGSGEHAVAFAQAFPNLEWQPSDLHPDALASIAAWRDEAQLPNLLPPIEIDASAHAWPVDQAGAILSINMVHISPWASALGLIENAARLLKPGTPLILYGPWLTDATEPAPSNLAFDKSLRTRDPEWGLRRVEEFALAARERGLELAERRDMPANNMMLLFRP